MDYGLLGGLAKGLERGIESYQTERDYQQKKKMQEEELKQKKLAQAAAFEEKGLIAQDDGTFGKTDRRIMEDQAALAKAKRGVALSGTDTPESVAIQNRYNTVLGNLNPAYKGLVGHDMSGADIEADPLIGKVVAGEYGKQAATEKAKAYAPMVAVKQGQLEESQNVHATQAGQAFETHPTMKQLRGTMNSLDRAESLLNGKEPITAKAFNVLQQDFINAMAPGGAATEGKVNREMIETAQQQLNDLQLKFGKVKDLRSEQPQIVENLRNLIAQVKGDYGHAQALQARDIHDSHTGSDNPKVQETIKKKLKRYDPEGYAQRYGEDLPSQKQGLIPNPEPTGMNKSGSAYAAKYPGDVKTPAPKPTTVKQNGVTYTLNPKTGEYE